MTDPQARPSDYQGGSFLPEQPAAVAEGGPELSAPNPWSQAAAEQAAGQWSTQPDSVSAQPGQTPASASQPAQGWQAPGAVQPTPSTGWQQSGPGQGWQQPVPGQPMTWGVQGPSGQGPAWTNYRPGIVPIRPFQLSDILDGAIKLVRFNPKATLGLSIIVNVIVGIFSVLLVYFLGDPNNFLDETDPEIVSTLSPMVNLMGAQIPAYLAAALLPAVLIAVTMQAVLGRKIGIGEAWRTARGRLISYLLAQLLIGLAATIPLVILVLFAITSVRDGNWSALLTVLLLGFPLVIVVLVWFSTKMLFAAPSIIIERLGPIAGIARSWKLTQGAFWRILGISLLTSMILGTIAAMISSPITIAVMVLNPNAALGGGVAMLFATVIAQVIASSLTAPFQSGVSALLYIDQRIRKEGFDIDLINEVGRQAA